MRSIVVSAAAALIATAGLASAASMMHRSSSHVAMVHGPVHHTRGIVRTYDQTRMLLTLTNGSRYEAGSNAFRSGASRKGAHVEIQWQEADGKRLANLVKPR